MAATWTVGQWLEQWLAGRTRIRATTVRNYRNDIDRFLTPCLGRIKLNELTTRQIGAAFGEIAQTHNRFGRLQGSATLRHLRNTLRAALNAAVREGLLVDNPVRRLELPVSPRCRAVVWTPQRVAEWKETGSRPSVAVWTPTQLAEFLEAHVGDTLYTAWWLIALRGLRRGEAAGLRWSDIDFDNQQLTIARSRTTAGYQVHETPPKTAAGNRTIALDTKTMAVLTAHRWRQDQAADSRDRRDLPYRGSGYVFTNYRGEPIHPAYLTHRFRHLIDRAGLPPIRLHDLRHGAATLAQTVGADLKTVQDQLGHSTIVTTADIYTSVLPQTHHRTAAATAHLVLDAISHVRAVIAAAAKRHRRATKTRDNHHHGKPTGRDETAGQRPSRRRHTHGRKRAKR